MVLTNGMKIYKILIICYHKFYNKVKAMLLFLKSKYIRMRKKFKL